MKKEKIISSEQLKLIEKIYEVTKEKELYFVGGIIRDLLIFRSVQEADFDFVVEGDSAKTARAVAEVFGGKVTVYPNFLTAKVKFESENREKISLDFVSTRKETYPAPGKLPLASLGTLEDDIKRRDFTINAVAVKVNDFLENYSSLERLEKKLIDFVGGVQDIKRRVVKVLHNKSFHDDPTRILRACKYKARINGKYEENTRSLIRVALENNCLETVSMFRVYKEIKRALEEPKASLALKELKEVGVDKKIPFLNLALKEKKDLNYFEQLDKLLKKCKTGLKYEAGLRLLLHNIPEAEAMPIIDQIKLGKKVMRDIKEERAKENISELSDVGLIYRYCTANDNIKGGLINEIKKRTSLKSIVNI